MAGYSLEDFASKPFGNPSQSGRYHLYVSLACLWAHRTIIFRKLKNLENAISISVVEPVMSSEGWAFSSGLPDHVDGYSHLHQLYTKMDQRYTGRVTVPVLWDKQRALIVNNESAEIIRMLNSEFAALAPSGRDYYPAGMRSAIDEINAFVYENVNNGVSGISASGWTTPLRWCSRQGCDVQCRRRLRRRSLSMITRSWRRPISFVFAQTQG